MNLFGTWIRAHGAHAWVAAGLTMAACTVSAHAGDGGAVGIHMPAASVWVVPAPPPPARIQGYRPAPPPAVFVPPPPPRAYRLPVPPPPHAYGHPAKRPGPKHRLPPRSR